MTTYTTDYAEGKKMPPAPVACDVVAHRAEFTLKADLSIGDLIWATILPAGHVPVDALLDFDALGAGASVSVGVLNSEHSDMDGTPWISGQNVSAAGAARATGAGLLALLRLVADSNRNRAIGIKVLGGSSAKGSTLGLTLLYRAA